MYFVSSSTFLPPDFPTNEFIPLQRTNHMESPAFRESMNSEMLSVKTSLHVMFTESDASINSAPYPAVLGRGTREVHQDLTFRVCWRLREGEA